MDPFVTLGDGGFDAEQVRAFRGPVARAAGAVFFAGDDDERRFSSLYFMAASKIDITQPRTAAWLGKCVSRRLRCLGRACSSDVGEGAADHDFVVASACAILIEVGG